MVGRALRQSESVCRENEREKEERTQVEECCMDVFSLCIWRVDTIICRSSQSDLEAWAIGCHMHEQGPRQEKQSEKEGRRAQLQTNTTHGTVDARSTHQWKRDQSSE